MSNIFVTYYAKQIEYGVLTFEKVLNSEFAKANEGFADEVLAEILKNIQDDTYEFTLEDLEVNDVECANALKEYATNKEIEL